MKLPEWDMYVLTIFPRFFSFRYAPEGGEFKIFGCKAPDTATKASFLDKNTIFRQNNKP